MKYITRTILALSAVSMFTDIASEMLYPIMPMFLQSIGFSVVLIGVLEGFAEAVAGFSKGYFGNLSDAVGRRVPFVRIGYALSAISKPMMALLAQPLWIFAARTFDRLGKGVRTGARDALLSDETTNEFKGRVFGFHRAFDTLGAAIGPLFALLFLALSPGNYKLLFLIAFIPGALAVGMTFTLKERRWLQLPVNSTAKFFGFVSYWKHSTRAYRYLVAGLLLFALINSSDLFLLLMLKHQGATDSQVILTYVLYNLVYALASFPAGVVADRIGLRATLAGGLVMFALVYGLIGFTTTLPQMAGIFALYGIYAANTEGISKAWITNLVPAGETATAIGLFTGFQSICALIASSIAGLIWNIAGPMVLFGFSSAGALLCALYIAFIVPRAQVTTQ